MIAIWIEKFNRDWYRRKKEIKSKTSNGFNCDKSEIKCLAIFKTSFQRLESMPNAMFEMVFKLSHFFAPPGCEILSWQVKEAISLLKKLCLANLKYYLHLKNKFDEINKILESINQFNWEISHSVIIQEFVVAKRDREKQTATTSKWKSDPSGHRHQI